MTASGRGSRSTSPGSARSSRRWSACRWSRRQFWVTLGNYIGLYSIVALGLVLLTGVAGQTSFGQAAFVGIGAYTTAVPDHAVPVVALAQPRRSGSR